ncbi:MAG: aldo/keto reductase [Bacteroidota bacterium]
MKKKKSEYSRRKFLSTTALGAAAVSAPAMLGGCSSRSGSAQKPEEGEEQEQENRQELEGTMPTRILGKTGLAVSILTFGGGSQFLKNKNGEWEKHLEEAVKSGINLFDTSPDYTVVSRGEEKAFSSEERFGQILPAYRDQVMISTKINEREASPARKSVEESLKRLKTDHVDIIMLHAVNEKDTVAGIENGVYREMVKMKEEGIAGHIGFSSMDSAERSKDLLENLDFDMAMLAMNPSRWGDYPGVAFPAAIEKNVGIIAMKVVRDIVGVAASAEELLGYAWDREGVASSVVGNVGIDILKQNIGLAYARGKKSLASVDKDELESRLAPYAGPHALCWARPGYRDGGIIV